MRIQRVRICLVLGFHDHWDEMEVQEWITISPRPWLKDRSSSECPYFKLVGTPIGRVLFFSLDNMKLWTVINLLWLFWGLKSFTSAERPDPTEQLDKVIRLIQKRQDASMLGGLGNNAAGFGNMMGGGGFGNMAGLGGAGAFPGGAQMGNPQAAGGMMGMQGFNANPFGMGAGAAGGFQNVPAGSFGNAAALGGAQQLMAAPQMQPNFGAAQMMNGFGGGMDQMQQQQQMAAPRFSPQPMAGGVPGMAGGFGAGGMGMNMINGGGVGMGNMGGMAGMGAPTAGGGAGFGGVPNVANAAGGMGMGMGGFQQNMGSQFIKRWSKSVNEHQETPVNTKISLSTVIDELKSVTKLSDEDEIDSQEATSCGGCEPLDLRKITGSWTQIYGNPESLRVSYTALSAFEASHDSDDGSSNGNPSMTDPRINDTSIQPACVGFHFERPFPRRVSDTILGEAPLSLHFRDDRSYRLYQVSGLVQQSLVPNQSEVRIRVSSVNIPMCLIKGGPNSSGDYDYVVLMETRGPHRCKALHVIARNSDNFFHNYSSDVIEYLQQKVKSGESGPVKIMPNPEQCEPRQQQDQWQQQQQQQEREGTSL